MGEAPSNRAPGWGNTSRTASSHERAGNFLLRVVDVGLCAVVCVAPFFFGGRHDFGRLVLVTCVAVTASAWFVRQSLLPNAPRIRTAAHLLILAAFALLVLQLVPLPASWIAVLSPRTLELLPLWTADGGAAQLGTWRTLSLMPHATAKSLAMFMAFALLFQVVIGRVECVADVRRLLRIVAVAGVMMAAFGLLQFFLSNGQFFWFYEHPYRDTRLHLCGSFINRNHFAGFLVLCIGPLAAWLWESASASGRMMTRRKTQSLTVNHIVPWLLAAALAVVVCTVLRSLSRGGAVALLIASAVFVAVGWSKRILDSRSVYALLALAVLVVGLLSLYGYDQVVERLDDFAQGSIEAMDKDAGRRKVWAANEAAVKAGWLTGTGAGSHAEICPVYLTESPIVEYTHAECGYLQVITENGIIGEVLLFAGIGLCVWWCTECYRRAKSTDQVLLFAACAAGLAASAAHSVVDFVWYIPACMSLTVVLLGCLLRLAQLIGANDSQAMPTWRVLLPRERWIPATALAVLASIWTISAFIGPGMAAIHWDRYLRASVANRAAAGEQLRNWIGEQRGEAAAAEPHNVVMLRQLQRVIAWDPQFARAQLRLAAAYVAQFESQQLKSENAMTLSQIQDAALASRFPSLEALRGWLHRALGENTTLLYQADAAARKALSLCPLQGEGYVFLGELCFLHGGNPTDVDACFAQALRVRPHDGGVRYEIGEQQFLSGQLAAALDTWQECFVDPGPHQLKIVYLLAGRIPAPMFLAKYSPDWGTLGEIWTRYKLIGRSQDLEPLLTYAAAAAERETATASGVRPMRIWYALAGMYSNVGRSAESLACLERAYECNSHHFAVRFALANALMHAGRFAEAETHVRWCLARRPEQKNLSAALVRIAQQRMAARESVEERVRQASFERAN
jgi:tetratricopeptide (TPR) repeat protein/O-antigen ligase